MRAKENSIDAEKCIKCSRCVSICPAKHLELQERKIVEITDDPLRGCIECAHCMSVCPTQAIVIRGYDYGEFEELPEQLPGLAKFEDLLKGRRSCRKYQDKGVPKEVLKKILRVATMAPIALPPHKVEVLVFDTREKVGEIFEASIETMKQWVSGFKNPVGKVMMRSAMSSDKMAQFGEMIPITEGIIRGAERGEDRLTYDAAAMFLFHASRKGESYEENCILAKTYAMIAAEGLGLGSCIIGYIPPIFKHNKDLKNKYEIPDGNDVVGCLVLGYPVATHNRSIHRDFKSVRWV